MVRASSLLTILLALFAATPALAGAGAIPSDGVLDFAVLRDGDEVGSHIMKFKRDGDAVYVDIATDVEVTLAFITVYSFWHRGSESWNADQLVRLRSETDDDGTPHVLDVQAESGKLAVLGDNTPTSAAADIIPASLWNLGMVRDQNSVVLNTLDGTKMAIDVVLAGKEQVKGEAGTTTADHYIITGELERELWYDPDGLLVKVRFKGQDGSDIEYVLR